nr:chromate transporter [Deinococcus sp. 6GRE01]
MRVLEVFLVFLRLGLTSFGGPVAHLGYFRAEFVTRRAWLGEAAYADLAAQLIPLALTVGLLVGVLVWWAFSRRQSGTPRTDIQERMVYRLAHRKGGRFTLDDLRAASPLTDEQARAVTARLLDLGRLTRDGDTFRLP